MLRLIVLLITTTCCLSTSAKILSEEIDFKNSIIKYYHSGAKVKIKLRNLPYNTDQVTISAINSDKRPKIFIIGKRNIKVANDNSIDFTIELEDLKPGSYNTKSSEIDITLYSYKNNILVIGEKAKFFIRPIICSQDGDGVCGTIEVECHKGKQNCENSTENRTFRNRCEMKKYEGVMLHAGPCQTSE